MLIHSSLAKLHSRNRDADNLIEIELGVRWGHNEIDETYLCTTIFRDACGDSSLLLSTVVSLPCEVSIEAQTSDLELTRVSDD